MCRRPCPFLSILVLIFCLSITKSSAQFYFHPDSTHTAFMAQSERFIFFNSFWINYHHFVYRAAKGMKYYNGQLDSIAALKNVPPEQRAAFREILVHYQDSLIHLDLRTTGYMHGFKRWIINFGEDDVLPTNSNFDPKQIELLNKYKVLYQTTAWPIHSKQNQQVLDQNIKIIRETENAFVPRLEYITRQNWQREKIRVDITYHSKRERPYTSNSPACHIVMDASRNAQPAGNWIELLYHESSHHMIGFNDGFIGGTIQEVNDFLEVKGIRQLSHAFLFYFTGEVTRKILVPDYLPDYELYMKRNRVFKDYHSYLDTYTPAYLEGERPFYEVARDLTQAFYKDRE